MYELTNCWLKILNDSGGQHTVFLNAIPGNCYFNTTVTLVVTWLAQLAVQLASMLTSVDFSAAQYILDITLQSSVLYRSF